MEQALTRLAVKIQFDDSTGFDEIRWTIIRYTGLLINNGLMPKTRG